MEKTKKLIGYVIVTLAVLCMLFAGIQTQLMPSYAAGNVVSSIENKPAPTFNAAAVTTKNGLQITKSDDPATALTEEEINAQLVVKSYSATVAAGNDKKTAIENVKAEIVSTQNTAVAAKIEEALTALKNDNKIDSDVQAKDLTVTDIFDVELTGDVLAAAQTVGIEVTFKVGADIALLKTAEGWETLEIVSKGEPNGQAPLVWEYASNVLSAQNETTVILRKSGIVVFQNIVRSNEPGEETEPKTEKCCDCCSENCPFCGILCKDGKCFCWTIYLVIALAVVLLVLIVVLIVVKSKAKKVVDVQQAAEEPASQEEADQIGQQEDEENK